MAKIDKKIGDGKWEIETEQKKAGKMTTYKRGANSHSLFPIKQQKQMVIWLQQQQQQLSAEKLAKRRKLRFRSEEDKVKLKSEIRRSKIGALFIFYFSVFAERFEERRWR